MQKCTHGENLSQHITASIVLYNHSAQEVTPLFEELAKCSALSEWFVVDNGGAAEASAVAESHGGRGLHPGRNLGFGGGHNLALKQSLGVSKYHIIVNPDIYFSGEVIESLYNFMEDHPDVGWVMPRIEYPDGTDQGLHKRLPGPVDLIVRRFLGRAGEMLFPGMWARYELGDVDMTVSREVPCLSGCFIFLRTSVLQEVGMFDERFFMYMEDVDLCRRVGRVSKCVYYPYVSVTHGYAKGSYSSLKLLRYHVQSAFRYFSKWGWFFDVERKLLNQRICKIAPASWVDREVAPVVQAVSFDSW